VTLGEAGVDSSAQRPAHKLRVTSLSRVRRTRSRQLDARVRLPATAPLVEILPTIPTPRFALVLPSPADEQRAEAEGHGHEAR